MTTGEQYDQIINNCRSLFQKKTIDYGTAWRILRLSSLTDQLYIKAMRIRSVQEKGVLKIDEAIDGEFIALVNYSIMSLIQMEIGNYDELDLATEIVMGHYDKIVADTKTLMENKNHDYGEAWRDMRVSSITDLILMKLLRIKQIEDNEGKTIVSEGLDANYQDILNYSVFALIKLSEKNTSCQ